MKYWKNNKSWYSIVISIIMVGFLIILTSGVFNLVLSELNDSKWRSNYLKAYAAAEWALELWLLNVKNKWYWYYDKIDNTVNDKSIILSSNPLDSTKLKKSRDVIISYDNDSKINDYTWNISSLGYDIIPLFYLDDSWEQKVSDIELNISDFRDNLVWNILSTKSWISWIWSFDWLTDWNLKTVVSWKFSFSSKNIWDFLNDSLNNNNYLIIFNSNSSEIINYNLKSTNPSEFFTKPRLDIISSAKIGNYKQNLWTKLDNTAYLNILKYSIYSN